MTATQTNQVSKFLDQQIEHLKQTAPRFSDCIDPSRIEAVAEQIAKISETNVDFETSEKGGRGDLYRLAQKSPLVRSKGILQLFTLLASDKRLESLNSEYKVLDVLGGDGVLARALPSLSDQVPDILTSDLSEEMIAGAQEYHLACIRQPAQQLLLKDSSMNGVILAYGTHHIPRKERLLACQEGYRVLQPNGIFLLHDFEEGSPVAKWFEEMVHPFSYTGHDVPHFTRDEIRSYLTDAGFEEIEVTYVYDPFIIAGDTEQQVKDQLSMCLLDMYGMYKLKELHSDEEVLRVIYDRAVEIFRYDYPSLGLPEEFGAACVDVHVREGKWVIEMPRLSIVGRGRKS